MDDEGAALVAETADMIQIGARNMQNYRLLEAVGRCDKAVLLKRGPAATARRTRLAGASRYQYPRSSMGCRV